MTTSSITSKTVGDRTYSPELVAETLYDYLVGKRSHELSPAERFDVYVQADGFGDCRTGERRVWLADYMSGGCDWSHVRDSSDEGMLRAFDKLVFFVTSGPSRSKGRS